VIRQNLGILAITLIFAVSINQAFAVNQLERVDITNPRLQNSSGAEISDQVNVNQQVQISADVKNNQEKAQKFVYIVQVKDQYGAVVSLSWIGGSLNPQQTFSPSLSWAPKVSGVYSTEIYVWESFVQPDALTNFVTMKITS
jgi:hypothetical protein